MASGKHSSSWRDQKNSFDNNDEYSSYLNNSKKNNFEEEKVEERNFEENQNLNNGIEKTENSYEENITFAESNFFDEEEKEFNYKKLIIIIAVIVVLIIGGLLVNKFFINKSNPNDEIIVDDPVEKLVGTYQGYNVLGKIKIDKINVEQYILDSTENKALENGVGKIDNGASINNYGNFCLAGHNRENIFKKLNELSVGDEFVLIDKNLDETIYEIKEIYSVEPDNLECLLQDENKVEVTLITCENGATTRLIVKAEEKNSNLNTSDTNVGSTDGEKDI